MTPLQTEHCRYVWDDGLDPELYERDHHRNPHVLLEKFYEADITIAERWCDEHGYTELHCKDDTPSIFWAYPPNGVMPVAIDMNEVKTWNSKPSG